jgi:hypothetical protein
MNRRALLFAILFFSTTTTVVRPQDAKSAGANPRNSTPQANDAERRRILRVYDVSRLFVSAPSHRATYHSDLSVDDSSYGENESASLLFPADGEAPSNGDPLSGSGGPFNVSEDANLAAEDGATELIRIITNLIETESWAAHGGPNSIDQLRSSLIISADEKTHAQVAELLEKLRKDREHKPTVSVTSHWLWLTDAQLRELIADDPPQDGKPRELGRSFGLVDRAAFAKHVAAIEEKDSKGRAGYRAAMTCFDGQTVNAASGRQSMVTSGFIPVVGDGNNVAFRPTFSVVKEGPAMQITPRISARGNEAVLDIRSRVAVREPVVDLSDVKEFGEETFYQGARRMSAMIEGRTIRVHQLATTIRTPLDKPILVGGMTYGEEPKSGEPCLYLFVTVTAQQPASDKSPTE